MAADKDKELQDINNSLKKELGEIRAKYEKAVKVPKELQKDNKALVAKLKETESSKDKEINALKGSLQALQGKLNEDQPDTLCTSKTFKCDTGLGRYIQALSLRLIACAETIQRIHLDPSQKTDKYALKAAIDSLQEALMHAQKAYK